MKIENTGKVGDKPAQKTTVEPVTQEVVALKLRSAGADSVEGTADDFDLAVFSGVISEQGKSDAKPKAQVSISVNSGAKGAIRGTIRDATGAVVPGVSISVNKDAPPDSRSYRVDFALYERIAPKHQPEVDLLGAIAELKSGLVAMGFNDPNFRSSKFMRLEVLKRLREKGLLDANLEWTDAQASG